MPAPDDPAACLAPGSAASCGLSPSHLPPTPNLSGRIHPRDGRGRGKFAARFGSFIAVCKSEGRCTRSDTRASATWPGDWSLSRQRSWDFRPFAALLPPGGWSRLRDPQPTCRFSNRRAAVLGSGSGARNLSSKRHADQGRSAAASGFSAGQAVHGHALAGRCCPGLFLFQVFGRTFARRPGLVTWAGRRSVGFCFQSLPLVSLVGDFASPALQRIT